MSPPQGAAGADPNELPTDREELDTPPPPVTAVPVDPDDAP